MTGQHTPGPWLAKPHRISAAIRIYGGPDEVFPVAITCSNTSPATLQAHRDGIVRANARLIAAAPELLEALQACIGLATHLYHTTEDADGSIWGAVVKARAAITKATATTTDAGVAG